MCVWWGWVRGEGGGVGCKKNPPFFMTVFHLLHVTWHRRHDVSYHQQRFVQQFVQADNKGKRYWPFVRGIHWRPLDSPHKGPVMHQSIMSCLILHNRIPEPQSHIVYTHVHPDLHNITWIPRDISYVNSNFGRHDDLSHVCGLKLLGAFTMEFLRSISFLTRYTKSPPFSVTWLAEPFPKVILPTTH